MPGWLVLNGPKTRTIIQLAAAFGNINRPYIAKNYQVVPSDYCVEKSKPIQFFQGFDIIALSYRTHVEQGTPDTTEPSGYAKPILERPLFQGEVRTPLQKP
jgi:hypothetical protein